MDTSERLLRQALHIVTGARRKTYGTPESNFACIGELWQTYLNRRHPRAVDLVLHPGDVAAMMALMKIARLAEQIEHPDSWRDLAGYAACGARATDADLSDGPDVSALMVQP